MPYYLSLMLEGQWYVPQSRGVYYCLWIPRLGTWCCLFRAKSMSVQFSFLLSLYLFLFYKKSSLHKSVLYGFF